MSTDLKFKVGADTSQAVTGFEQIGTAAKKTKKEVQDVTKASGLSKQWKEADQAVSAYAKSIALAGRRTEELAKKTSKWRSALSKGLKLGGAAVAGVAAAAGFSVHAAAERQSVVGRLGGTMGNLASAQAVGRDLSAWGASNNADPNELLKHVDRLVKAGLSADQAVQAVKSSVIAAAGDASKMEGILEPLTEFATKGFLEEEILDKFAELGVDIRGALQTQLGMTRDQLDQAVADHTVTAEAAVQAMAKLTAEGTKLHDSHQAALSGMAGSLATISRQFEELKISFGTGIGEGMEGAFKAIGEDLTAATSGFGEVVEAAGKMLGFVVSSFVVAIRDAGNAIISGANWVAEKLGIDYHGKLFGEKSNSEPLKVPEFNSPELVAQRETNARRSAAASLAAQRLAARDAAAAKELEKNLATMAVKFAPATSTDRRTAISYAAGFGGGPVSSAAITEKMNALGASDILARQRRAAELETLLSDLSPYGLTENSTAADFAAAAAGDWEKEDELSKLQSRFDALGARAGLGADASNADIAAAIRSGATADLETTRKALALADLRDELEILEKEEQKTAEIVADYERRMAIQDALIAGDKERADLLTQQAESEKLAADYAAKGIDLATAQQMAAAEIAKRSAANSANKSAFDPLANNVKLRETISSPLANIGGGGVRLRFYENQQVKAATDTATNTANIATAAAQILTHLQTKSQIAILA